MQYPYFQKLMEYVNRMGHLLSGGRYPARAAVLYHADAEWSGEDAQLYQKPLRSLMERQIDADVIPCDVFSGTGGYETQYGNTLKVGSQEYECLVIPAMRFLPQETLKGLEQWMRLGGRVLCIDRAPDADDAFISMAETVSLTELPGRVMELIHPGLVIQGGNKKLRTYSYENDYGTALLCFNEAVAEKQEFTVLQKGGEPAYAKCGGKYSFKPGAGGGGGLPFPAGRNPGRDTGTMGRKRKNRGHMGDLCVGQQGKRAGTDQKWRFRGA